MEEYGPWNHQHGKPLGTTNENGNRTHNIYDVFGRIIQTDLPDGGRTSVEYFDDTVPNYKITRLEEDDYGTTMDRYEYVSADSLTDASRIDGYNANGTTTAAQAGGDVAARYVICVRDDLFTPDYLISPLEVNTNIEPWEDGVTYNTVSFISSYALPRIRNNAQMAVGRAKEWSDNANASAIVVTDRLYRNTGATPAVNRNDATTHYSLQSTKQAGKWTGGVSFNDNHVESVQNSEIESNLSYANINTVGPDNIFSAAAPAGYSPPASGPTWYNAQQIIRKHDTGLLANE